MDQLRSVERNKQKKLSQLKCSPRLIMNRNEITMLSTNVQLCKSFWLEGEVQKETKKSSVDVNVK